MTMITPSYLGETIEYSSLHACRSTLEDPTVTNEDNIMVRVDHQLSNKTGIFGRYTFDRDNLNAPGSLPSALAVNTSRRQYTTLQANSILGPKALNNFRFAFNRTHISADNLTVPDPGPQLSFIPGQPLGAIQVGGITSNSPKTIATLGPSGGANANIWAYNIFEWADDFSYVTGKHSLKAGVDIQRMQDNQTTSNATRGQYTFTLFTDLLAGRPSNLQAGSPLGVPPYQGLRQRLYGIYGQDDYTVNSRLTLNLGFRWETSTDPVEVNGQMSMLPSLSATNMVISDRFFSIGKKNFEPRFGLAWRLDESGKTVLRVGGGIYHNQIFPWAFYQELKNPPFSGLFSANNPPFPNGYQILKPGGGLITLQVIAPFDKTPVNEQYNLSIQREIFKNTVVQFAYAGNHANHLLIQRAADSPVPTILSDGRKFYPISAPRQNTAWNGIRLNETDGDSVYNSVTITLRRQSSSGFLGQIFYTFSKAMDEATNTRGSDSTRSPNALLDPEDRARDWGLAEIDSRHAVVGNFSYPLPFRAGSKALGIIANGWTFDGIGTFTAGMPFTARLAAAVSRDLSNTLAERPDLIAAARQNPNNGTTVGCAGIPAGQKLGTADRFYDPCSFSLPLAGTYGNLGRTTIIGPGVADVDLALEKGFKLREEANVTFKAELFNIMNHSNFGLPNTTALAASGAGNAAAGRITYTTTSSRQLQFALRISF